MTLGGNILLFCFPKIKNKTNLRRGPSGGRGAGVARVGAPAGTVGMGRSTVGIFVYFSDDQINGSSKIV